MSAPWLTFADPSHHQSTTAPDYFRDQFPYVLPGVAITDESGAAGLLMWIQKHRPELAEGLGKRDERLTRVLELVMREYNDGRVTALADEEVHQLIAEAFGAGVG